MPRDVARSGGAPWRLRHETKIRKLSLNMYAFADGVRRAVFLMAAAGSMSMLCLLFGQEGGVADPWDQLAARADRVRACNAIDQETVLDPMATAASLYQQALNAVDGSSATNSGERMRRGAFRAGVIKRMNNLTAKQSGWNKAYQTAFNLSEQHSEDRAQEVLIKAAPPPCWSAYRELTAHIRKAHSDQDALLRDGDDLLLRAESNFDLKAASQLYQDAIAKYGAAQQLNVDDKRPGVKIAEAKALNANIASLSGHEVLVLSNPGGARLKLTGGDKDRSCPATPCKFQFDVAYFDQKGGDFVFSKRSRAQWSSNSAKRATTRRRSRLRNLPNGPGRFRGKRS